MHAWWHAWELATCHVLLFLTFNNLLYGNSGVEAVYKGHPWAKGSYLTILYIDNGCYVHVLYCLLALATKCNN